MKEHLKMRNFMEKVVSIIMKWNTNMKVIFLFLFINIKISFQNGHKHGEGKETYKNGTVYEG